MPDALESAPSDHAPFSAWPQAAWSTEVFGAPAFEQRLDVETGSRARAGNRVQLLLDELSSCAERDRLIDGARSSIHLQTFVFTGDESGWKLAGRLVAKAEQGVEVRIIHDPLGAGPSEARLLEFMKRHGIEVRALTAPLERPSEPNDRWIGKRLIVDGRSAIEGGVNLANGCIRSRGGWLVTRDGRLDVPWREAEVRLEGPSVADAQRAFLKKWASLGPAVPEDRLAPLLAERAPRAGSAMVRVVQQQPGEDESRCIQALYLRAVESARTRILVENACFLPPLELCRALSAAAFRGVQVRVLTRTRASTVPVSMSGDVQRLHDALTESGVEIWETRGGTLHARTATFDGVYSIVGPANLGGSPKNRGRVVMAIGDPPTAVALEQRFAQEITNAAPVANGEPREEPHHRKHDRRSASQLAPPTL